MDLILEQFPIVFKSLNIGFLQTLKLFFVTLLGAVPLGLVIAFGSMSRFKPLSYLTKIIVWIIRGTPLMIQLLIIYFFPGLVMGNNIWGGGEAGRFLAAAVGDLFLITHAIFAEIYSRRYSGSTAWSGRGGACAWHDAKSDFFQGNFASMVKAGCGTSDV